MDLKGYAVYSEVSTLLHIIIFALAGYVYVLVKKRFAKPSKPGNCACSFAIGAKACKTPYCIYPVYDKFAEHGQGCKDGYCAFCCARRADFCMGVKPHGN